MTASQFVSIHNCRGIQMSKRTVWVLVNTASYDGWVFESRVFSSEEAALRILNFTPSEWSYYYLTEVEVEE